ncbi:hypothetical protein TNIN_270071 [Trichonephila inaurata madagascariensis]|uniref:Uncharacterized protein n=1 Tax=Trichonephila inaurata madagascariensis TaxID=2747483 RepID=A0A8X6Y176_9ARAC|nr:hypothetical protein TNIN_270071 [Trichonephila inaurata madagascariensis]
MHFWKRHAKEKTLGEEVGSALLRQDLWEVFILSWQQKVCCVSSAQTNKPGNPRLSILQDGYLAPKEQFPPANIFVLTLSLCFFEKLLPRDCRNRLGAGGVGKCAGVTLASGHLSENSKSGARRIRSEQGKKKEVTFLGKGAPVSDATRSG